MKQNATNEQTEIIINLENLQEKVVRVLKINVAVNHEIWHNYYASTPFGFFFFLIIKPFRYL